MNWSSVTDENGELFEYHPSSTGSTVHRETQRIQETLFHEKQTIIENCLFGVDINPNSVKICRLRLWIELLKNAYYKNTTELETLPNIDINIKCGNSLVSRFALDADLSQALKKNNMNWSIDMYPIAVDTYRNAQNKEQKREMERLIDHIKADFRSEISKRDPKFLRKIKLEGELFNMTQQGQLFEMSEKEKDRWSKRVEQLNIEIEKITTEIETIKANKIYENALEWRFEFPEKYLTTTATLWALIALSETRRIYNCKPWKSFRHNYNLLATKPTKNRRYLFVVLRKRNSPA